MNEIIFVMSAAVLNFVLGAFWYSLFGKQWMLAWNLKPSDIDKKDPIPYLVAFIGSIWTSYGMFLIIKHIVPKNLGELLTISVGTWLFLIVGSSAKHYAFAGKGFKAFSIDYGLDLLGILLMSFILWKIV